MRSANFCKPKQCVRRSRAGSLSDFSQIEKMEFSNEHTHSRIDAFARHQRFLPSLEILLARWPATARCSLIGRSPSRCIRTQSPASLPVLPTARLLRSYQFKHRNDFWGGKGIEKMGHVTTKKARAEICKNALKGIDRTNGKLTKS